MMSLGLTQRLATMKMPFWAPLKNSHSKYSAKCFVHEDLDVCVRTTKTLSLARSKLPANFRYEGLSLCRM